MTKRFLILIFILVSIDSYCMKRDTTVFKNSVAINLESFLFHDIKLTYSHRIKDNLCIETMISYNIPYSENSNLNDNYTFGLVDPFFLYGRFQVREGLKMYLKKNNNLRRFYSGPELLYSYGQFEDGRYCSYPYKQNPERAQDLSRKKNEVEFFYKIGWTFYRHGFYQDIYLGFGLRFKFFSDTVYEDMRSEDEYAPYHPYPDITYPYHQNLVYYVPTIHLGYQIGICK